MNTQKTLILLSCALLLMTGCKNSAPLLPKSSGKAGEVIVVISKDNWESSLGEDVRRVLACDCPWLPTREPLYTLVNVAPGAFGDLFKQHRNILFFDINPQAARQGVRVHHNKWSDPQCVIQVSAFDDAAADSVFNAGAALIANAIEQAERERVILSTKRYEKSGIHDTLADTFPGAPHFPTGYRLRKLTEDFAWISDDKQYSTQGVFIYKYPSDQDLSLVSILKHRNEFLKSNVPGMFDGTYMITADSFPPYLEYIKWQGRQFAQVHGLWEVKGDFMGGPFVSHSFYSPDGEWIVVAEAWVYAPRFEKRQLLRQVESILYTWE